MSQARALMDRISAYCGEHGITTGRFCRDIRNNGLWSRLSAGSVPRGDTLAKIEAKLAASDHAKAEAALASRNAHLRKLGAAAKLSQTAAAKRASGETGLPEITNNPQVSGLDGVFLAPDRTISLRLWGCATNMNPADARKLAKRLNELADMLAGDRASEARAA